MTFGRVTVKPKGAWHHAHDGDAVVVLLMGRRHALPSDISVNVGGHTARRAAFASDGCDRSVWQFVAAGLPAHCTTIAIDTQWPHLVEGAAVSLTRVDPEHPVLMTEAPRFSGLTAKSRAVPSGSARTLVIENGDSGGLLPGVLRGTMLARDESHGQWVVAADVERNISEMMTVRAKNPYDAPLVHLNVTYRPVSG